MPTDNPIEYKNLAEAAWAREEVPFRLADLPPEIRIHIFEIYLYWRRDMDIKSQARSSRRQPELIQALRPLPVLYDEALEVYYDNLPLVASNFNLNRVKYIPRTITGRVRSMELWYG
jgi:hypothetical protein